MGKPESKQEKEEIIIAQNGAGNSATASEAAMHYSSRVELYSLATLALILLIVGYIVWKRCKNQYEHFLKRTLLDNSVVVMRQPEQRQNQGCQQVIV